MIISAIFVCENLGQEAFLPQKSSFCNGNSWSLRLIVGQINWFVMFSHRNIQIYLLTGVY